MHEFQIERKDYKRLVITLYVLFVFLQVGISKCFIHLKVIKALEIFKFC